MIKETQVKVNDVIFKEDVYPRFNVDNGAINRYRTALNQLPPIVISKNYILIDGYHRLTAHKLESVEKIKAIILDIEDDESIFLESLKRNSAHGKQLSLEEKRENAIRLYKTNGKHRTNQEEIANILSVSQKTVNNWLRTIIMAEKEVVSSEILRQYLNCRTQEEIAENIGISQRTVGRKLESIFSQNGKGNKMSITPSNIQYTDFWEIERDKQRKYPRETPIDILENIIYYYSPEPKFEPTLKLGKVIDISAGAGDMKEACDRLYRKCLLYDETPIKAGIEKHILTEPFPEIARNSDLVFLNLYGEDMNHRGELIQNIYEILTVGGKVAVLSNLVKLLNSGFHHRITEKGFKHIGMVAAPLNTIQFSEEEEEEAVKKKEPIETLREVFVFRKVIK